MSDPETLIGVHQVFQNPELAKIAKMHRVQMGGSAMCMSVTPSRNEDNYRVWHFNLDKGDMAAVALLNYGWRHLLWAETSMHEDYPFKDELPAGYKLQKPGVGATAGAK